MGERLTISIDYCPQCRGIWLEKGKLDQLLNGAGVTHQPGNSGGSGGLLGSVLGKYSDHDHDHHHSDHDSYQKSHKKKSLFDDLF
jgi:Zn-finger nucleic acid-binding protein